MLPNYVNLNKIEHEADIENLFIYLNEVESIKNIFDSVTNIFFIKLPQDSKQIQFSHVTLYIDQFTSNSCKTTSFLTLLLK